jgi:hypothetical protein
VGWFSRKIAWWKNPSKAGGEWTKAVIDNAGPYEFAIVADYGKDGDLDIASPGKSGLYLFENPTKTPSAPKKSK